ncbi:MAG: glycosyltransferase family 9 protein [Salibacteraceae bacterium]
MKIVLFVSAGLGNALLLLPLMKKLKARANELVGVFVSDQSIEQLFEHSGLLDEIHTLKQNQDWVRFGTSRVKSFDEAYLDFFSATRKNILLANTISNKTITNHIPRRLPPFLKHFLKVQPPTRHVHETTQNMKLLYSNYKDADIEESMMRLPGKFPSVEALENPAVQELLPVLQGDYIVAQVSAANNKVQYKNWPLDHWIAFLTVVSRQFPKHEFVLLGDKNETELAERIMKRNLPNVHSLVGKTTISELNSVIAQAQLYLGCDSGLMHLAVALGRPTFTIWGASDFNMYGYHRLFGPHHGMIFNPKMDCRPCNSWLTPNQSRVTQPEKCPDFRCLRDLTPIMVINAFNDYVDESGAILRS